MYRSSTGTTLGDRVVSLDGSHIYSKFSENPLCARRVEQQLARIFVFFMDSDDKSTGNFSCMFTSWCNATYLFTRSDARHAVHPAPTLATITNTLNQSALRTSGLRTSGHAVLKEDIEPEGQPEPPHASKLPKQRCPKLKHNVGRAWSVVATASSNLVLLIAGTINLISMISMMACPFCSLVASRMHQAECEAHGDRV